MCEEAPSPPLLASRCMQILGNVQQGLNAARG